MAENTLKLALWGLPNAGKTTFAGTLLHRLDTLVSHQTPPMLDVTSYKALEQHRWPDRLDLEIELMSFHIKDESGSPWKVYLLDPPGAFLDPDATVKTCPPPFEHLSLYQYLAECDGIILLFDSESSQQETVKVWLKYLFKQLLTIHPDGIKPHLAYAMTHIHPIRSDAPQQMQPVDFVKSRIVNPADDLFGDTHISRRPHRESTFWTITAYEDKNQLQMWQGMPFSVLQPFYYVLRPGGPAHPLPPQTLHVAANTPAETVLDSPLPSIFISHNTLDAPFVNPLVDALKRRGIRVWKAPESIRPGEDWVDAIERGLSTSSHVVLVISPGAVDSEWVKLEMNTAIRLEREGKIEIIPLSYEPCETPLLWGNYQSITCKERGIDTIMSDLLGRLEVAV
jgi:hypothetical protein